MASERYLFPVNKTAPSNPWRQSHSEHIEPRHRSHGATTGDQVDYEIRRKTESGHTTRKAPPRSFPATTAFTQHRAPSMQPAPGIVPPPMGVVPPPPGLFGTLPGDDSEDEDDSNDISTASFDVGSGALVEDSNLKISRQKADLEAKLKDVDPLADAQPLIETPSPNLDGRATYSVIGSRYNREGESDSPSDISSCIEYLADLPTSRRRDRSIFRWIHLKHDNMDFEAFSKATQEVPGLPQDQIQSVSQFLRRIRKEMERPIRSQRGATGNFMKAGLVAKIGSKGDLEGDADRNYVFACIPYHQLAPYKSLETSTNTRLHPVRTLLQSKHPSTPRKRDFEQAVRFLGGTPPNHVFHVSNLWCLIINNKFMITSASGLSADQVLGERTTMKLHTPTQPLRSFDTQQGIQVLINSRHYIIPLSQCNSWFNFTQNFYKFTLTLHDDYIVTWKGAKVNASLWPLIIEQTNREAICLVLSQRKRPLSHGVEDKAEDGDMDDLFLRPSTPNDDKLSIISEADSTRSWSSGKNTIRDSDSLLGSPKHNASQSGERLQSPIRKDSKKSPQPTRSGSPIPIIVDHSEFHILTWIALRHGKAQVVQVHDSDVQGTNVKLQEPKPKSDRELVQAYLNSIHLWLEDSKHGKASALYRKGPQKTLDDVERAMQGMRRSQMDPPHIGGYKNNLLESVKSTFTLFLPLEQRSVICAKLWGALHMAITAAIPDDSSWQIYTVSQALAQVAVLANTIKAQLSGGNAPAPESLVMPPAFLRVWHQLLLCLLFWSPKNMTPSQNYATKCLGQLQKAHQDLMKNQSAKKLEKLEAVLPYGLLTIMVNNVIQDFTKTQPGLVESYWEYFGQLEEQAEDDPLNRRNQSKITSFIKEGKIVLESLMKQQYAADLIYEGLFTQDRGWRTIKDIRPTDPAQIIMQDAVDNLQGKISSMEELLEISQILLDVSLEAVRQNRNKQEAAIYTFTIVTIIFLPTSTVASILGMNTFDVRNMEKTQWVFWATALPVTAIVIIVSLYVAGIIPSPFKRSEMRPRPSDTSSTSPMMEFLGPREAVRSRRRTTARRTRDSSVSSESRTDQHF